MRVGALQGVTHLPFLSLSPTSHFPARLCTPCPFQVLSDDCTRCVVELEDGERVTVLHRFLRIPSCGKRKRVAA